MALHTCPKCDRPLTKPHQWHYCKKISVDDLLVGKPQSVSILLYGLIDLVGRWDGVSYSATKSCVVFLTTKTFLVVKVMKNELDLKFTLPAETDEFPIYKMATYGKKLEHYIRLRDEEDLDNDVQRLLFKSYQFALKEA